MEKSSKVWLIILFAVVVYLLMGIYADFEKLSLAMKDFRWTFLFVLFALTTINYLFRFLKWDFFLKRAGVYLNLKDNLFVFFAVPRHPHTVDEVLGLIDAEIERLKNEPVSDHELQKIINQTEAGFIRRLGSNSGLASQLSYFELIAGDWRYMLDQIEAVRNVTAEDIQRVAHTYLTKRNRTVAELVNVEAPQTESIDAE